MIGLVETGAARSNNEAGRCLVLLGTITPTVMEGLISNSFSTPDMSMVVNGALVDSDVNECDVSAIEAAGYGWILNADVTVGTEYPFYSEFFITSDPAEPQIVVLGSPTGNDGLYFAPTILDAVPAP